MIRPLTLKSPVLEKSLQEHSLESPALRKRTDSLVFSVTSQKFYSPKDTMLMESKQHDVSKELETLQLKLDHLENKVERIDSQNMSQHIFYAKPHFTFSPELQTEVQSYQYKENKRDNINKAGKIVKKERESLNKTTKIDRSHTRKNRMQTFATHHSRQSKNSLVSEQMELATKMKELSQLRKEVTIMKNSMQKSQRSKSVTSERLSASKNLIKSLKKDEKKQQKIIERLRSDLKKSETIRQKQKQLIAKQQAELNYYREVFKTQKLR